MNSTNIRFSDVVLTLFLRLIFGPVFVEFSRKFTFSVSYTQFHLSFYENWVTAFCSVFFRFLNSTTLFSFLMLFLTLFLRLIFGPVFVEFSRKFTFSVSYTQFHLSFYENWVTAVFHRGPRPIWCGRRLPEICMKLIPLRNDIGNKYSRSWLSRNCETILRKSKEL